LSSLFDYKLDIFKTRKMKKDIKTLSLSDIAVYVQQIQVYMDDMQQMLNKIGMIKEKNKFFDNDSKIKNAVVNKLTEVGLVFNNLQVEIQRRAAEDLGIDFDYEKLSDYDAEVKKAYMAHLGKMMKEQGIQMVNSPEAPQIVKPGTKSVVKKLKPKE
jgi:hypothetical protein